MKKVLFAALAAVIVMALSAGHAYAWTYGLSGSGACQTNGSYQITWKVDNSTENEALKITSSSNVAVVPVGTQVAAKKSANFIQVVDGTKPGSYSLILKGNWKSDKTERTRSATVYLKEACKQPTPPVTPPEGGRGGDEVVPVTPAAAVTPTPQVEAPAGAVNAGEGASSFNLFALAGLTGSAVLIAAGARRFSKITR